MKFPLNIHIGSLVVNAHLIFETLAYMGGYQYFLYLKRHQKDVLNEEQRLWILVSAAAGALLGSHVVGYFAQPIPMDQSLFDFVHFIASKSILGGLLGGILSVELAKLKLKIEVSTGDLLVYPIILAIMIGRLGCFSQGVYDGTHGNPSNLPWAMNLGDGILRHPTQLYEIVFLGLLWLFLKKLEPILASGTLFKLFMILYLIWRFLSEWLKPLYFYPIGLSGVQIAALLGLIYYFPTFLNPKALFKEKNA